MELGRGGREFLWHGGRRWWHGGRRWWPKGFSDQDLEKAAGLDQVPQGLPLSVAQPVQGPSARPHGQAQGPAML